MDEHGNPTDGRGVWLLGLEQDRHWPTLLRALGNPPELLDERFANAVLRGKNAEAVVTELDRIFRTYTYDDLTAAFDANDVWWAPINSIVDVLADPVRNRFMIVRQNTNEVLVFDKSLRQVAALRTGNTPTQMAITADSPRRSPSSMNCVASADFPVPDGPATRQLSPS